jgi:hypothetical protein
MESEEVKKRKLIANLIAVSNKLIGENRIGKANYITVPDKNIEAIAKKFNVTVEKAQQMLKEYFESALNK